MSKKLLFSILALLGFFWASTVKAICPLCVVAVGAGLGLSRWLGIDDVVSSVWIGALMVALIGWTIIEMRKHNKKFPYDVAIISVAYYALTFIPLYYAHIIGHPLNKIFGIDKIVFGTALGTVVFLLSYWLHNYLKKKNNGKSFFPYQKVILPLVALILTSLIFFILLKYRLI